MPELAFGVKHKPARRNGMGAGRGAGFASGIADGVSTNGALTSLNMSDNKIGLLSSESGWTHDPNGYWKYTHSDGRKQDNKPAGEDFKPLGVIALADGISANGALASLDLSQNDIPESETREIKSACAAKSISLKI